MNDISTQTLYRHWDKIEKLEIVKPTRKVGNSQMYKLNEENELVKRIYQFDQQLREHQEVQELIST